MDNFDLKSYLIEGRLYENEMEEFGKELADAIEDEFEDNKELQESVAGVLSTILAGTTLVNILSKYVEKIFTKYNFGKGAAAAKMIEEFTHELEEKFKSPIDFIVGKFVKDKDKKEMITNGLFILVLLALGLKAGKEAFTALKQSSNVAAGISGLKAALKGKDIVSILKNIV
jgi:vacuolar-type H+-ATPase subunit E/Vma4